MLHWLMKPRPPSSSSDPADWDPVCGSAGPERSADLSRWWHVRGEKHLLQEPCWRIWMLPPTKGELPVRYVHE